MKRQLILSLSHISKRYGKKEVLKDIDVSFSDGKIIAIVGENGCGKSTLLKIILRLAKQTGGQINDNGLKINGVIETPCFFPRFSGTENLTAFIRGNKIDIKKLNYLADEFRLKDDLNYPVRKYSLGMKQKLAIIYILLSNADILLFDEPTNALDQTALITFKKLLYEEREKGKLIIVSSHDLNYLNSFVDEIYELKNGYLASSPYRQQDSCKGKSHLFMFSDINKAIVKAQENGCFFEVADNKFLIIKDWFLPFEKLLSVFETCEIKLYFELGGADNIYRQLEGLLHA